MLAQGGHLDIPEAASTLSVSRATIRRDLDHLAHQQLLTRTRGGATANNVSYDLPLRYKEARHTTEKQRIAQTAAALVEKNMVVALTGGTTTSELARTIAMRHELRSSSAAEASVTIVTNALNIAAELVLRPHVKIVLTGGIPRTQSFELIGPLATRVLADIAIDIAFLGVDGIDPAAGAFTANEGEAVINRLMSERAQRTVIVADGSKLGRRAFARICTADEIDTLVTDRSAAPEMLARFRDARIDVIDV